MCAPLIIMAVAGAVSAYGQYQQGQAQKSAALAAADASRLEGQYAVRTAAKQAELIQETASIENKSAAVKAAEVGASQRAAMAASGVDTSSVTSQDIAVDTLSKAKLDEMMIRRNANLNSWDVTEEAKARKWALDNQAQQQAFKGKQAAKAGAIGAFTTLLSTAATMGMGGAGAAVGAGGMLSSGNQAGTGMFGSRFMGSTQSQILGRSTRAYS
jgi:hypothetical protein